MLLWIGLREETIEDLPSQPCNVIPTLQSTASTSKANDFNSVHEIVAFCLEETSERGADKLLKILSHPHFSLSDVTNVVRNKATLWKYVQQQPHLVSDNKSGLIFNIPLFLLFIKVKHSLMCCYERALSNKILQNLLMVKTFCFSTSPLLMWFGTFLRTWILGITSTQ